MADRKGFEPLCPFERTPFQGGRLDQLSHLSILAEAVRFELTDLLQSLVFKTSAIDHSTTLPLFLPYKSPLDPVIPPTFQESCRLLIQIGRAHV